MCRTDRCAVAAGREVLRWRFDRWTRGCGARATWCAVALEVAAPDDPADEDAPREDPVCEDPPCEDPPCEDPPCEDPPCEDSPCGASAAPEEPDDDWLLWSDPEVVAGWGEGELVAELG